MTSVGVRELRSHTRQVLDRVRAGESVIVTVDGRPAAVIGPLHERPRFMDKASFLARLVQADPQLSDDLVELVPETTDDQPW